MTRLPLRLTALVLGMAIALLVGQGGAVPRVQALAVVQLAVDASVQGPVLNTQFTTQLIDQAEASTPAVQTRLAALQPQIMRVHADDGVLPAGQVQGNWDFTSLDQQFATVRALGAAPALNVRFAPDWMWTCTTWQAVGALRDPTYQEFAGYLVRLVSYYNAGQMTAEDGRTIVNPAGVSQRIPYLELWNEPDLSNETPCRPANNGATFSPQEYVALWNAVAPQLKGIDPGIQLIGPVLADQPPWPHGPNCTSDYIPTLISNAIPRPDAVSWHTYGGDNNAAADSVFIDDGDCYGLKGILNGAALVRSQVGNTPLWISEANLSADDTGTADSRASGGFGAAWMTSLYRGMMLNGVTTIFQFHAVDIPQYGLVDAAGQPYLPYWRDYYMGRYFPSGSTALGATSSNPDVEVLAAQPPDGTAVRLLVINRQLASPTGRNEGVPTQATITVAGIGTVGSATLRMLDDSVVTGGPAGNLTTGPALQELPPGGPYTLDFAGYGAALLEFVPGTPSPRRATNSMLPGTSASVSTGGPGSDMGPACSENRPLSCPGGAHQVVSVRRGNRHPNRRVRR